jgi:CubicO group peptidase (beta-lactamase class C family)
MTAPETTGTRIQVAASAAERSVVIDLTGEPGIMRVSVGDADKGLDPPSLLLFSAEQKRSATYYIIRSLFALESNFLFMNKSSLRYAFLFLAVFLVVGLIFCAGCASAPQTPQKLDGFDDVVTAKMAEYEVPGAVVGIVENDTVVYLKGFGVREIGKPDKVDPDTRFQVASISKYFNAAGIGTLVEEGKLDWDTPVVTYLPGFALKDTYAGEHATLRDLLTHRTGLKPYDGGLLGRVGYSNEEMLEKMRYLEPGASFREKNQYSNAAFFIAGEVAAAADNRSWEDLTDARIIRPLGMTRSGAHYDTLYLDDNRYTGYRETASGIEMIPHEIDPFPAAGQVVSTGRDMTQFMRMMLNHGSIDGKQVLLPKTVDAINAASFVTGQPDNPAIPFTLKANGFGCDSFTYLGERVVEKNGGLDGVRSLVVLVPDRNIGIVVIASKHMTEFPEAVQAEFLERYIGKSDADLQALVKSAQATINEMEAPPKRPAIPAPATIPPSALAGNYRSDLYGILQVSPGADDGNMTFVLGPGRYPGTLSHWTDNTWLLSFPNPNVPNAQNEIVTFTTGPSGFVTGMTTDDLGLFARV